MMKQECRTKFTFTGVFIMFTIVLFLISHITSDKLQARVDALENPPVTADSTTLPLELKTHHTDFTIEQWINYVSELRGFKPDLIYAIIDVESGWNPEAISPQRALGIMQVHEPYWDYYFNLFPTTIEAYDLPNDPFNEYSNIYAGINALADWRSVAQSKGYWDPIDYINCYNKGNTYFKSHSTTYSTKVINTMLQEY